VILSRPFIERPVATTLLTIGVVLAGIVAYALLPVAPLPQVDFPTISVQASLPGASPDTMATSVATPLERSLGRIAGITEMTSSSALGSTRITLQFDLTRDIDGAARDVMAAINAARALLPTGLPSNPTYRKVNPADPPIIVLAVTSDTMTRGQMYDAASTILAQKLSQVEGVGQVSVSGSSLPAVRAELNPQTVAAFGLGLEDVRNALANANANRPKGALDDGVHHWQIYANDQALTAKEYAPLIVAYRNGAPVRLSDLGRVIDSVEDVHNAGQANGKPAVMLQVNRQPGANIIATVGRIMDLMPVMRAMIPSAMSLDVMVDRTPTIRASLRDVERTMLTSVSLVVMVVFLFLRTARASAIPSVAVPVSLIGTFGIMWLCHFSLNILSLMALTIATGFVVDDAIVVLENITRHIENGESRMQAALNGVKEVGFTVVSMSLSLIAVFIPILMMGGIVGRYFREFAVTLSAAILVSLAVSLTTTPMMCSRILTVATERGAAAVRGRSSALRARLSRIGDRISSALITMREFYAETLRWALQHSFTMVLILFATIALTIYLYIIIPKGFFPQQDTGRMIGSIQADQAISFDSMAVKFRQFIGILRADPAIENVVGFTGGGQVNSGFVFMALKPLSSGRPPIDKVMARLRGKLAVVTGANLFLAPVQDIRVGGRQANALYQYTLQSDDLELLRQWAPKILHAAEELPQLVDVNTDQQDHGIETMIDITRDTAMRYQLTPKLVDNTLNDAFGQRQVSTIYEPLNQYHVVMEVDPIWSTRPEDLNRLFIATPADGQVPLTQLGAYRPNNTPLAVNHQGQFAASTISFNLPEGTSLGQATRAIEDAMARIGVPPNIHGSFQGTAKAFQESIATLPVLVGLALLTVYIVLGILYESYIHPLTILSTLPSAGVGALLALMATHTEFTVIAFIGVILLVGIVKKNAIMMIDFAIVAERSEGLTPAEAIYKACLLRFRPIMMTTMAALFGAIPLAVLHGDGAEMRQPLGIAIVGGLLLSQLLTLYTTPVVYLYLDRFSLWLKRARAGGGRPGEPAEAAGVGR
jgi:multidrug efflux pump